MDARRPISILVLALVALGLAAAGCVPPEETVTPSPTPTPEPTPAGSTYPVEVSVYYDENGDGGLAANEIVRVPGVDVRLGGRVGRTERRTGNARIEEVPAGQYLAEILRLPPYYEPSAIPTIGVPAGGRVPIGLTLEIGANQANVYMAFGDSITEGVGSTSGNGYRDGLVARLRSHFGAAKLINEGVLGSRTGRGRERLGERLAADQPAYTLILYGTNDWNDAACKYDQECPTVDNLRAIIRQCFATRSLPIVGTIPPVNPDMNPGSRNVWVAATNDDLRLVARSEGAAVADVHAAFMQAPNLAALFFDHVHPNDAGYELIAKELFRAISGEPEAGLLPLAGAPPELLAPPLGPFREP